MEFHTIKSQRLYIQVAEQIQRLLREGTLKPGERLPAERDLAERLGVSRPTVREAMIALELAGWIEVRSGSGIYASKQLPSSADNDRSSPAETADQGIGPLEILEIRYILEGEACALAASRISDEQLAQLRQLLVEMEEEEKQPDASEKADGKFHSLIAEACQNSAIYAVIHWLWQLREASQLSQFYLARLRQEGVHPSIQDHRRILQALEKRDPEKARMAMKIHIENATQAAEIYFSTDRREP
jgi:DNA-binding FadR family transcriptional regulator